MQVVAPKIAVGGLHILDLRWRRNWCDIAAEEFVRSCTDAVRAAFVIVMETTPLSEDNPSILRRLAGSGVPFPTPSPSLSSPPPAVAAIGSLRNVGRAHVFTAAAPIPLFSFYLHDILLSYFHSGKSITRLTRSKGVPAVRIGPIYHSDERCRP